MHRSTVSLALKRHPNISRETCERIKKIATDLGYTPDPMLSALASYRNKKREVAYQGTLAWLVRETPELRWTKKVYYRFYLAAKEQAHTHGYNVEVFDLNEPGLSPERLGQILRSRNIQGILVCPQPQPTMDLPFPWEHFASVTFGFSLLSPKLHTVAAGQFSASVTVVKKLRKFGHERIGFVTLHDDRANNNFIAGYLSEMFMEDKKFLIPPLHPDDCNDEAMGKWYRKHKPTAIIGPPDIDERAIRAGIPIEEVTLACAFLPNSVWPLAGVSEDAEQIGRVAANVLVSMIQQGERGIPGSPQCTLVEGAWLENRSARLGLGQTLRAVR